jgi:hypothetical protein
VLNLRLPFHSFSRFAAGLIAFHSLRLVWLQQQPVGAAASTPPDPQQVATSSSSSSSSSGSNKQGSLGSPATTAAEFEGLLDWLLDDGQQLPPQQQQSQQQQALQAGAVAAQPEPQPGAISSSSSSSSSTSSAMHGAVVAAATSADTGEGASDLAATNSGGSSPHMPFTVQKRYLTDAAFWHSYAPAVLHQRQWQRLLQRGAVAAQLQYDNMIANALDKATAEDGSDFDCAEPGAPVVDAGADAAAAGLFWP